MASLRGRLVTHTTPGLVRRRPGSVAIAYLSFILVTVGSGCGGCGGGEVSLDSMPEEAAKTVCSKTYECCNLSELTDHPLGPDQASCESQTKANLIGMKVLIKRGEEKGRIVYHGDRVAECLEQYGVLRCQAHKSNATSAIPSCDSFLEPRVPEGGACEMDEECIGGSCEGERLDLDKDGVCRAYVAEGGSCEGATCGAGLFCDVGTKQCRRRKADGTSCYLNGECSTGGCNGVDAGVPGTCGLKGGASSTCYATTGCSSSGSSAPGLLGLLAVLLAASARGARQRTRLGRAVAPRPQS